MNYGRYTQTAYGRAWVEGENGFPQPPPQEYKDGKAKLREAHDKIVASAEKCIAYKQARKAPQVELPDGNYLRLINDMYRSMALASGPANLSPVADMPKTRETPAADERG